MSYFSVLFGDTNKSIKFFALSGFSLAIIGAIMPFVLLVIILAGKEGLSLPVIINTLFDTRHLNSLLNSFFLSVIIAGIVTLLSCLIALLFRKLDLTGNRIIYGLAIIPAFIPDQVVGIIGRIVFDPTIGLLSDVSNQSLLMGRFSSLLLVVLFVVLKWLPLMVILCDAMIYSIPNDLYYITIMDMESFGKQVRYTYLPQMKNILIIIFAILFLLGFRQHELVIELTSSGPGFTSETWSLWNYKQVFAFDQVGKAAIEAIMILFLLLIPIVVIKNHAQRISQ